MNARNAKLQEISIMIPSQAGREYTGTGLRNNDANISIRNYAAGTGNAVTDLIFSIAKRDVTFFSGTAPISFL